MHEVDSQSTDKRDLRAEYCIVGIPTIQPSSWFLLPQRSPRPSNHLPWPGISGCRTYYLEQSPRQCDFSSFAVDFSSETLKPVCSRPHFLTSSWKTLNRLLTFSGSGSDVVVKYKFKFSSLPDFNLVNKDFQNSLQNVLRRNKKSTGSTIKLHVKVCV